MTSELSSANDDIDTRKLRQRKMLSSSEKTKFQNKSKCLSQQKKVYTSKLPSPPVFKNNSVKGNLSFVYNL